MWSSRGSETPMNQSPQKQNVPESADATVWAKQVVEAAISSFGTALASYQDQPQAGTTPPQLSHRFGEYLPGATFSVRPNILPQLSDTRLQHPAKRRELVCSSNLKQDGTLGRSLVSDCRPQ
jgi:hypothetical protein